MEPWLSSLRVAVRSLWRFKGLSFLAVLCLGLGIGTCVTLFATVNPWLFRPLPYPTPDRLVGLRESLSNGADEWSRESLLSVPNYLDWQARSRSFEGMGAFDRVEYNLSSEGEPERVQAARITADLLTTLGVAPAHGRGFAPDEDRPLARVALIGHRLWQRRFEGDPAILGRTLTLNGVPYAIVGVMPAGFAFPEYAEVWTPLGLELGAGKRDAYNLDTVARLRLGISAAQAEAELKGVAAALEREHPDTNRGRGALARPLLAWLAPPGVVLGMYLLLAAGLFVQLIACANVVNLLLVKAAGQRQEIAVRLALGAGWGRVFRQLVLENILLVLAGATLGLALGSFGVDRMLTSTPVTPPFWVRSDIDWRVVAFTAGVAATSAVLVGLLPALQFRRSNLLQSLKSGERTLADGARGRLGRFLVVSELSVALLLLIGAALMVQSFTRRYQSDPGLDARGVTTARLALSGDAYGEPERRAIFVEELVRRLRSQPGVSEVGATTALPFRDPLGGGWWARRFEIEGHPVEPGHAFSAEYCAVTPDYFAAAGIRVEEGRSFTAEEEGGGRDVAVVSGALARRAWGDSDPLGQRLRIDGGPWLRTVGVVHEVRDAGDMLLVEGKPPGQIYVPYGQNAAPRVSLVARAAPGREIPGDALRRTVHSLDPTLPVYAVFTLADVRMRSAWVARVWGGLMADVAALALILAALGVFGVVSHTVSQRRHEIGIRMALGADRGRVLRMLLGDGLRLAMVALPVGLLGAWGMGHGLQTLLYGIDALDPFTLLACGAALTLVTLVASFAPARRATRVDPAVALRAE